MADSNPAPPPAHPPTGGEDNKEETATAILRQKKCEWRMLWLMHM